MEATSSAHDHHHHHEMPTEGSALTGVAVSATLHCLTGCAIGEIAGMAIGTAVGLSDFQTVVLAVSLAFVFGYTLTSLPLLRAGLALSVVIPIALASDTLSIATMEVIDNAVMVAVPGAMDAGLGDILFWGALSFALAVAFVVAVPVNRWLLARGKGHTAVHNTGIHGGPPPRVVGTVLAVAAIFGTTVLVAEAATNEDEAGHMGGHEEAATPAAAPAEHAAHAGDLQLALARDELPLGETSELGFRVLGDDGEPLTEFDVLHEKRMHLIVVRRDLTGFQHLHPRLAADGTWSTPVDLPRAGDYRVFADFSHDGERATVSSELTVDGDAEYRQLPVQDTETETASGYDVGIEGFAPVAGETAEMTFNVVRDNEIVKPDPYLGAGGHLVVLREGDLEFLHVHPVGPTGADDPGVRFMAEFPSPGSYRLFFQFRDDGKVHTAEFTREVS